MKNINYTLYLVTDSTNILEEEFLFKVEEACIGGITLLQLREKEMNGKDFLRRALQVKKIADKYEIPLIINDRIDIALAIDAAGVHLGQSDIDVKYARKILGKNKIIGATTKTLVQAQKAVLEGADYLGVGAIYNTTTKVVTVRTEVSTLKDICTNIKIPVVAIGGLNLENCDVLKDTKIKGIAVVSAIIKSKDPRESSKKLKEKVISLI